MHAKNVNEIDGRKERRICAVNKETNE